eukprot:5452623-Pleurochrysis_carterae.AAC.9
MSLLRVLPLTICYALAGVDRRELKIIKVKCTTQRQARSKVRERHTSAICQSRFPAAAPLHYALALWPMRHQGRHQCGRSNGQGARTSIVIAAQRRNP